MSAGVEREAARQRAFAAALRAGDAAPLAGWLRGADAAVARGLAAYVANAGAAAERSLAASFPTVRALVGEEAFAALARAHARAAEPAHGDLFRLGEGFAATLDALAPRHGLAYLADVARLDWAVALAEVAADAAFEPATLQRLAHDDPRDVALVLRPGSALVDSPHPIAAIRAAHAADAPAGAFDAARAALEAGRGERVVVWRREWRGEVATLAADEHRFMAALDAGSLGAALDAAGQGFDFAAWLARALALGWLVAARAAGEAAR